MSIVQPLPPKAPAAILPYDIDWSAWLAPGETITAATVTADTGINVNPSGKSTTTNAGVVTFWLGGGASGATYMVTITITTNSGAADSRTISVSVGTRMLLSVS
ncbi:hypothetical protein [Caballeronia sp. NCTM5]|uniref:phage fiber-tail adaptor protein n=1 Tax=Caballeronia sp. NCTM5 TaxID=2921755 RepID=UPI0020289273|nr:hypothetical protein [Caballeronia sp. NCTM5]